MNHSIIIRFTAGIRHSILALAVLTAGASHAAAQKGHAHPDLLRQDQSSASALLRIVRDSTERFQDVHVAMAEGYVLQFGCVSGSDSGAMGLHYVNGTLVESGILDPRHPQIVIYEPMPDGSLELIGADYLVLAQTWHATHSEPPEMMGQLFHLFDAPNRFGLPPFYTLHVWAWKDNPNGAFVNWHPNVSCASYAGTNH
ncbi:MAG: hypothetical protein C5B51_11280 [Terriglobia bacterium]|nr:MAG: hypothetical protein C5B51_11280 [Terriglobia bacterium]